MKAMLILVVVVGAVLAVVFYAGGFSGFDAAKQAEEFRASIRPGMTWEQVCDLKEPRKYIAVWEFGNQSPPTDFDRTAFADLVNKRAMKVGFAFPYRFTSDHHYRVWFDAAGKCEYVKDMLTLNDLATGKPWKR